jgi:hypothetical protein
MGDDTVDIDLENEVLLSKKLEQARKTREDQEKIDQERTDSSKASTQETGAPIVFDEKEALYEGLDKMGCTKAYLTKMKERHGTIIVYPHEDGKWFVVRPLKVREMRMIREIAGQDLEKLNKEILESGCIFPKLTEDAISELPAGLPDLLVNMISRLSAFIPVELAFSLSKEL